MVSRFYVSEEAQSNCHFVTLAVPQVLFLNLIMDWETPWVDDKVIDIKGEAGISASYSELSDEDVKENNIISIESVLPDELLERILAYLPIASIFRASSVCKKWNEIVHSHRFLQNISSISSQKPWYFMFPSADDSIGFAYDPMIRKWYSIELRCDGTSRWFIASSCGLVCFMDQNTRSQLYVCNPITNISEKVEMPRCSREFDYSGLAISVDRSSRNYTVAIVISKDTPDDFVQWILSIHIYCSEAMMWLSPVTETLTGWRGGDSCVVCDGVFYFLIYSTRGLGFRGNRHGLLSYNLSSRSSSGMLIDSFIPVPCPLTCGRLMNLKNKLVLVGGIGKQDQPGIIKGIGIWILKERDWEEVARMPHKYFQGFGEFDDVFASSGFDDLIYIQSYGAPCLLMFDMKMREWKWSQKCPILKRFPLQLFTGFSFEPRIDISP